MSQYKYRWVILVLSYICMLGFAFTLQSVPPILTLIIHDLKLTHTEAGLLVSLFALPSIILSIFAGLLSDRLGPYRVGIVSLILVVTGMSIFAFSGTFVQAALSRVIAGIGAATLAIVSAQILSRWFRGREVGTAMGIYNTAMPVGTIVCFTAFGRIGERSGWQVPIFITVVIGITGLLAFLTLYRHAPDQPRKITHEKGKMAAGLFSNILKIGTPMWLIGLCWMWFNATIISFSTFAPDFFISKGYSIGFAGFLVSLLMWGSLGLSPVIGHFIDRLNNNEVFIGLGGMLLGVSIFLVYRISNVLLPMGIMSMAVAFIPAPVFSFPSKILKPENLGLVFGILFMFSSMGMFFGPYTAGLIRDKTGSYETSFFFLSLLALLIVLTALILRIIMKRNPKPYDLSYKR